MAGKAKVEVLVKAKDQASGKLKGITNNLQNLKKAGMAMAAVGGALAAGGLAMVRSYAQAGDEIQKMALRTGFATETLSELRHAAELSGASIADIEKSTKKMSKSIIDASRGLETYERSFRELGLNIEGLRKMKPEEQFWTITEALAELKDETLKTAIAQEIFGRSGTQLLPMLASGAEGIKQMREEAHELGIVFDQEAADAAADFNDAMTRLKGGFQGAFAALATELMPQITEFIEKASEAIKKVIDWAQEHPELTAAIVKVSGALTILLMGLGTMLMMAPGIKAMMDMMAMGWLKVLGPIGLVLAAVGALVWVLRKLGKTWAETIGIILPQFGAFTKIAEMIGGSSKPQIQNEPALVSTEAIGNANQNINILLQGAYFISEEQDARRLANIVEPYLSR